jgi:hypothetical protein
MFFFFGGKTRRSVTGEDIGSSTFSSDVVLCVLVIAGAADLL